MPAIRSCMFDQSLEEMLQSTGNPADELRQWGTDRFSEVPDVCTNWIEEQRAWRETCSFYDQSHHMANLHIEGPDALQLLSDLGVNNFDGFETGQAKQLVVCNPDGYLIGDTILFCLAEEHYLSVGLAASHQWIQFNAEKGDYDVSLDFQDRPVALDEDPHYFRYQVQGPSAVDIVEEVSDNPLSDVPFFNFDTISIGEADVNALRHGMSGERGFELWGSYQYADEVKQLLMEAGEAYGIRELGSKSYQSSCAVSGWLPHPLPAIYDGEEMKPFREWLDAYFGIIPVGGSFYSEDISDYYLTPGAVGYDHIVDLDHDFIGRDAVAKQLENPQQTKVTLVWNPDDVLDIYASLFEDGETYKYLDFLEPRWAATHYDAVTKGGETVGVSKWGGYTYNERDMISLCCIDVEYSEPGTEVTVVWGDRNSPSNPEVERHVEHEIRATVAQVPYTQDRR